MKIKKYCGFMMTCVAIYGGAVFGEEILTWTECVEEALKRNPDIIAAQETLKKTEYQKKITVSSLYPQINGSMRASISQTEDQERNKSYSYGVSGSQLLFDGFKSFYDIAEARRNYTSAAMQYRETSARIRLNLRNAFIALVNAYEQVKLSKTIAERRSQNLKLVQLRYEAGREHKGALLTAVADDAQAQFDYTQAQRNAQVSQHRLVKALGKDWKTKIAVESDLSFSGISDKEPDFDALLDDHPTIIKAKAQTDAAYFSLKSANANFIPEISASGSLNKSGDQWEPKTYGWSAGLSLSMPIFTGLRNMAERVTAKASYNQQLNQERSQRDDIALQLQEVWKSFVDAAAKIEVQKKKLEAAQERSRIAQAQYSTGLLTFDDWIIIEDNLVQVEKTYLESQAQALLAQAQWQGAIGKTLEDERGSTP